MKKGVDYPGVTVSYFCHDGKGNVVMSLRGKGSRDEQGTWDIGGGGVDLGESVSQTLRKEVKEEYCADILEQEFLGYRDVFREQNGVQTHWILLGFKVRVNPAQVKNGEPHKFDDVRWFKIGEFPQPLHSQFMPFFEQFKDKLLA